VHQRWEQQRARLDYYLAEQGSCEISLAATVPWRWSHIPTAGSCTWRLGDTAGRLCALLVLSSAFRCDHLLQSRLCSLRELLVQREPHSRKSQKSLISAASTAHIVSRNYEETVKTKRAATCVRCQPTSRKRTCQKRKWKSTATVAAGNRTAKPSSATSLD